MISESSLRKITASGKDCRECARAGELTFWNGAVWIICGRTKRAAEWMRSEPGRCGEQGAWWTKRTRPMPKKGVA